jgi:integrase/recombinase XerD
MHSTVGAYRAHLQEQSRSPKTIREYTWHVQRMLDWTKKDPVLITPVDLAHYRHHLTMELDYKRNSMYISTRALQDFFSYLGLATATELTRPKRTQSLPKFLSEEETRRLIEASRGDARDLAILTLLCYTGLRVSEACALEWGDIDFTERVIRVQSGKGGKARIVIFEDSTRQALRDWLSVWESAGHDRVFTNRKKGPISVRSVERIVERHARSAGISKVVTPHVLRHTFATTLLRRGMDIRIIQVLLGHASVATTQIYTHVDDSMLKSSYDKAAPRY